MKFLAKAAVFFLICISVGILSAFISFMVVTGSRQGAQSSSENTELIQSTVDRLHQEEIPVREFEPRTNILVVGTDQKRGEANILVSFSSKSKALDLIFIPRDTYYPLKGGQQTNVDKLMQVYGVEGGEGMRKAVAELLGQIEIPYDVVIDYAGFEGIIDGLGGVPVAINQAMYYTDPYEAPPLLIEFQTGTYTLNGEDSLKYVRYLNGSQNNKLQRGNDLGRIEAMKGFLASAMNKALSSKLPVVINTAFKHVDTNMSLAEMTKMTTEVVGITDEKIAIHTLPGEMTPEQYYVVDEIRTKALLEKIGMLNPDPE